MELSQHKAQALRPPPGGPAVTEQGQGGDGEDGPAGHLPSGGTSRTSSILQLAGVGAHIEMQAMRPSLHS